jgi:hypothetical protein
MAGPRRCARLAVGLWLVAAVPAGAAAEGSGAAGGSGAAEGSAAVAGVPSLAPPVVTLLSRPEAPVELGRPFEIRVKADRADLRLVSATSVGNRYFEAAPGAPVPQPDGSWVTRWVIFRTGEFTAKGLSFTWSSPDGGQATSTTGPVSVTVPASLANENDLRPAPVPDPLPVLTRNWWPLIVGGTLGALGLGFGIAQLVRRYRRAVEERLRPPPPRPSEEIAREALDALERDGLLERGASIEFHLRLSEILRAFVGADVGFNATEMTTTEVREQLEERGASLGLLRAEVLRILEDTDMVKFARFSLPDDVSLSLLGAVRSVVDESVARRQARLAAPPELDRGTPEVPGGSTAARP